MLRFFWNSIQIKFFSSYKVPWKSSVVETIYKSLLMQNTHRKSPWLRVLSIVSVWADNFNQLMLTLDLFHASKHQQYNEEVDFTGCTMVSAPLQSGVNIEHWLTNSEMSSLTACEWFTLKKNQ